MWIDLSRIVHKRFLKDMYSITTSISRALTSEKVKFLLVGLVNTVFGFVSYSVIYSAMGSQANVALAVITSYFLASLLAFFLYKKFVFRVAGHIFRDYSKFVVVYVPSLLVNILLLPLLVKCLNMNPYFAQAFVLSILAILSYLGHKFFTFSRPTAQPNQPVATE